MKFLFIIQGEERGHLMHASIVARILVENGHEVTRALVGCGGNHEVPLSFYRNFNARVETYDSPRFVMQKNKMHPNFIRTILANITPTKVKKYIASMQMIRHRIDTDVPDIVVNFYEFLGGFMGFLFKFPMPIVSISNQNILHHSGHKQLEGCLCDRFTHTVYSFMANASATYRVGVSLRNCSDQPNKNLFALPPLVPSEVKQAEVTDEGYILGYIDNDIFAKQIMAWHDANPQVHLIIYYDKESTPQELRVDDTLTILPFDEDDYLHKLSACSGFITTGDIDMIADAMYLNKPLMIVPTSHYQTLNALEAVALGGAIYNNSFNISLLTDYMKKFKPTESSFREWVGTSEQMLLKLLVGK